MAKSLVQAIERFRDTTIHITTKQLNQQMHICIKVYTSLVFKVTHSIILLIRTVHRCNDKSIPLKQPNILTNSDLYSS